MIDSSVKVTVSVIIPFYNVEAYIGKCAECLMKQTYPWIEYIFVNDGSPDDSEQVLREVLSHYPHRQVRILRKENGGLPQARLTGLKEAKGEYVLHVDSDDWMEHNMVEKLLDAALREDADVAYCAFFSEKERSTQVKIDRPYISGRQFSNDILIYRAHGYMWNKLIRRRLFRDDIFYPTLGMHEDMVLLCQVLPYANRCVRVDEPLYHYRRNNGASISHDRKALRDSISARNFLQLFAFWHNREDAPFQDVLPELYLRIGWTTYRWNRSLLREEPSIKGHVLALPLSRFTDLKSRARLLLTKNWLRTCIVPSNRVLCCIFNHNENHRAITWSERISPWFPTVILDSGSQPPCDHPSAVKLDNIYYSGLMNEAWRRAREGGFPWVMLLTSDLEISSHQVLRLVKEVERMSWTTNVGLYQPANSEKGFSHWHSRYVWPPKLRRRSFQEGWFHLVRTDLLDKICPIDLSVNTLGWGLDTALSYFSIRENKLILVDSRVTVRHPAGTGYNREEAERQMWEWYKTIPGFVNPSQLPVPTGKIEYGDD